MPFVSPPLEEFIRWTLRFPFATQTLRLDSDLEGGSEREEDPRNPVFIQTPFDGEPILASRALSLSYSLPDVNQNVASSLTPALWRALLVLFGCVAEGLHSREETDRVMIVDRFLWVEADVIGIFSCYFFYMANKKIFRPWPNANTSLRAPPNARPYHLPTQMTHPTS